MKALNRFILLICSCFLIHSSLFAQKEESKALKPHSPKRASLYSAVLPGLGQVYNEAYWKVPVIYTGLITSVYFIVDNNDQYQEFRSAYNSRFSNGEEIESADYTDKYKTTSTSSLLKLQDFYRNQRDFATIISVGIYLINIVDAAVDAHLFHFDVSEDLSMNVQPILYPPNQFESQAAGFSLSINF